MERYRIKQNTQNKLNQRDLLSATRSDERRNRVSAVNPLKMKSTFAKDDSKRPGDEKKVGANSRLDSTLKTQSQLYTKLKQNRILKVYTKNNRFFIDSSAAYELDLINEQRYMGEKPQLVEIDRGLLEKYKKELIIEYHELDKSSVKMQDDNEEKTKNQSKRQVVVYKKDGKLYIEQGEAYALKFTNVRSILSDNTKLFEINEKTLDELAENEDIEITYNQTKETPTRMTLSSINQAVIANKSKEK